MPRNKQKNENRGALKGAVLQALIFDLLADFPDKNQEIIKRRFGLTGKSIETLEAIGKDYGITRERVRQIEAATLKSLKKGQQIRKLSAAEDALMVRLNALGDMASEQEFLKEVLGEDYRNRMYRNLVLFVLHISDKFFDFSENKKYKRSWALKRGYFKRTEEIINMTRTILKAGKEPVTFDILYKEIDASPAPTSNLSKKIIQNYLFVSKEVVPNRYRDWGLATWSQINPRGVKDRAYIVLKKKSKPLHFREITNLINESKLSQRPAHAPTVHNELIKDPRFVLVGRGIYALRDWGFKQGTVKEIIVDILKKINKPLDREKLVSLVLKQRLVRRSTVLLNLQDNSLFTRNRKGEVIIKP